MIDPDKERGNSAGDHFVTRRRPPPFTAASTGRQRGPTRTTDPASPARWWSPVVFPPLRHWILRGADALQAEREAEKAEALVATEKAERVAVLEAEQKAARDIRYAARKAAKKERRKATDDFPPIGFNRGWTKLRRGQRRARARRERSVRGRERRRARSRHTRL
jgi:hypothetical protein